MRVMASWQVMNAIRKNSNMSTVVTGTMQEKTITSCAPKTALAEGLEFRVYRLGFGVEPQPPVESCAQILRAPIGLSSEMRV